MKKGKYIFVFLLCIGMIFSTGYLIQNKKKNTFEKKKKTLHLPFSLKEENDDYPSVALVGEKYVKNNITLQEKTDVYRKTKENKDVYIGYQYSLITGLKDKEVEKKINEKIKEVTYAFVENYMEEYFLEYEDFFYKEETLAKNDPKINLNDHGWSRPSLKEVLEFNGANLLSIGFYTDIIELHDSITFDLNTGNLITINDLFKTDSLFIDELEKKIYEKSAWDYSAFLSPFQTGYEVDKEKVKEADIEDTIFSAMSEFKKGNYHFILDSEGRNIQITILDVYQATRNCKETSQTQCDIEIKYERKPLNVNIDLLELSDSLVLYSKYIKEKSLFEMEKQEYAPVLGGYSFYEIKEQLYEKQDFGYLDAAIILRTDYKEEDEIKRELKQMIQDLVSSLPLKKEENVEYVLYVNAGLQYKTSEIEESYIEYVLYQIPISDMDEFKKQMDKNLYERMKYTYGDPDFVEEYPFAEEKNIVKRNFLKGKTFNVHIEF